MMFSSTVTMWLSTYSTFPHILLKPYLSLLSWAESVFFLSAAFLKGHCWKSDVVLLECRPETGNLFIYLFLTQDQVQEKEQVTVPGLYHEDKLIGER